MGRPRLPVDSELIRKVQITEDELLAMFTNAEDLAKQSNIQYNELIDVLIAKHKFAKDEQQRNRMMVRMREYRAKLKAQGK